MSRLDFAACGVGGRNHPRRQRLDRWHRRLGAAHAFRRPAHRSRPQHRRCRAGRWTRRLPGSADHVPRQRRSTHRRRAPANGERDEHKPWMGSGRAAADRRRRLAPALMQGSAALPSPAEASAAFAVPGDLGPGPQTPDGRRRPRTRSAGCLRARSLSVVSRGSGSRGRSVPRATSSAPTIDWSSAFETRAVTSSTTRRRRSSTLIGVVWHRAPLSRTAVLHLRAFASFQWKYRGRRREFARLADELDRAALSHR